MDAINAILTRRSIRYYDGRPVPEDVIKVLLRAAMAAPSAGNQQPWHFVVITDRKTLDEFPRFHPYGQMCSSSSLAILVCGSLENLKYEKMWMQDCAASTQNILLAAHAQGFGAVWAAMFPHTDRMEKTTELLALPNHIVPFALVPIGYPAESKPPADRFDPARIHQNRW